MRTYRSSASDANLKILLTAHYCVYQSSITTGSFRDTLRSQCRTVTDSFPPTKSAMLRQRRNSYETATNSTKVRHRLHLPVDFTAARPWLISDPARIHSFSTGIAKPVLTRSITALVRKRRTLSSAKKWRRVKSS